MFEKVQLPISLNQQQLFQNMRITPELNNYNVFVKTYESLWKKLPNLVHIEGVFKLWKNTFGKEIHEDLAHTSHLVYCLVTLGKDISDQCTAYFAERDYVSGMMIDSIADLLLFNASNNLYTLVCKEISEKRGYGLTRRYSPDDRTISIVHQKTILDVFKEDDLSIDIGITEGYMYSPLKTLGYVYGADRDLQMTGVDHDCRYCSNINCEMRKSLKKSV